MRTMVAGAVAIALAAALTARASADISVAVLTVTSDGVGTAFGDGFDAGKAFTTLLTDKLVNGHKLSVVERENIERIFDEQKLSQSADFSTADSVKLGHMVGANYVILGRVIQLDKAAKNSGGAGALLSAVPLNIGGAGASTEKVHAQIVVRVVDASTGRIVKSINFDRSQSGTSFAIGDLGTGTEIYASQQFASSVVGKLLNAAADEVAKALGDTNLTPVASGPIVEAAIIALDGANVIINKGTADGMKAGTYLETFHRVSAKDPTTGKVLTTDVPDGQIQITSVGPNTSVARKISGNPAVRGFARTQ